MEKPFVEITGTILRSAVEMKPPLLPFTFPQNKDTGEDYPNCCERHRQFVNNIYDWFAKFPHCCEWHSELSRNDWFSKDNYKYVPEKIIKQVIYTETFILNKIDDPNWLKEISDYLEANEWSFGEPSIGYDHYKNSIKNLLGSQHTGYPQDKREKLLDFFEPKKSKSANLNILFSIYDEWIKFFPFALPYFKGLKDQFTSQFPIFTGEPEECNPYSGMVKIKVHSERSFVQLLVNTTKAILDKVKTSDLLANDIIKDRVKYQIELINENHRINQSSLLKDFNKGEIRYITILKKWLKHEKAYIREILPLLEPPNVVTADTKTSKLEADLRKYGFFEIPMTKRLSNQNQLKLIELLSQNKLPYQIAMLVHLDFIKYLEQEHFHSKYKMFREISKWLSSDKTGRNVQANIGSLLKNSAENKKRYTAHLHVKTVEKDYQNLK